MKRSLTDSQFKKISNIKKSRSKCFGSLGIKDLEYNMKMMQAYELDVVIMRCGVILFSFCILVSKLEMCV